MISARARGLYTYELYAEGNFFWLRGIRYGGGGFLGYYLGRCKDRGVFLFDRLLLKTADVFHEECFSALEGCWVEVMIHVVGDRFVERGNCLTCLAVCMSRLQDIQTRL